MDVDKLYSVNSERAMSCAYNIMSSGQTEEKHYQVAGICLLFQACIKNTGLTGSQLVDFASRVSKDADKYYIGTTRGMKMYVENELK